jgi:hypothetical protein
MSAITGAIGAASGAIGSMVQGVLSFFVSLFGK